MKLKVSVLIPTYNAGPIWEKVLKSIISQTQEFETISIIDSGSTDGTVEKAMALGLNVTSIKKAEFTHGLSRHRLVTQNPNADIFVFLTQDAVLTSPESVAKILKALENPSVGAAYGRQLPCMGSGVLESHNRLFNYPEQSSVKGKEDISHYGFKTIFCSNSFAAYKKDAYFTAGGFPVNANFGEDSLLVAKMILRGWKVAYAADATVYHSHHLSITQEFKRYFEIGRFHQDNGWLYKEFGKPGKEGLKYTMSELRYSLKRNPLLALSVVVRCFNKLLGYKAGYLLKKQPVLVKDSANGRLETSMER